MQVVAFSATYQTGSSEVGKQPEKPASFCWSPQFERLKSLLHKGFERIRPNNAHPTISSAVTGEKHITISAISVILPNFCRSTVPPDAALLRVGASTASSASDGSAAPAVRAIHVDLIADRNFVESRGRSRGCCMFASLIRAGVLALTDVSVVGHFNQRQVYNPTSSRQVQDVRHVPIRCTPSPSRASSCSL